MTEESAGTESTSVLPATLRDRITKGREVFLLDTRTEDDFEEWHITGETVDVVNYPYFNLLDGIPDELHSDLPDDQPITVVCAKGGASDMVADHLDAAGYDAENLTGGMKQWARIYETAPMDVDGPATIVQFQRPSSGCLAYLVASAGEAAVIDPLRTFADEYVEEARALDAELTHALDTHVHADHISGVRALAEETDARPVLPDPAADRGIDYDQSITTVTDGDAVSVGDVDIEVVHTPGHTSGMTTYRVDNALFTGDGLFVESVARPDLEDPEAARNAAATLYETLAERVLDLPDETIVAPGHFGDAAVPTESGTYTATLGHLRAAMDPLSFEKDRFVEFIVDDMPPRPANYEEIIATNLGQETPDDERAFELELGPNNCAASEEALTN
jgi:glyoxylase-like metal-dependent hydrolase (beta-lactamase superfamily II)